MIIEKEGHRIVVDPGNFFTEKFKVADLGKIDAVLYTHQHADHFDDSIIDELKSNGAKLYGNPEVVKLIGSDANMVESGKSFELAGFQIRPHDLPHSLLPDGSEGPHNTGYIIDGLLFHAGDGIKTEGFEVDAVALPIAGPDISFLDAIKLTKTLKVKKVIPVHYDGIKVNPESFVKYFEWGKGTAEVIILENGQSTEI